MPCRRGVLRPLARSSTAGGKRGEGVRQRYQDLGVVDVRAGDQGREWEPVAVAEDVDPGAGFAAVDRVWTCLIPLFVARTAIESTMCRDQSISLITLSLVRNWRCSRSHNPALVHSPKRRCTVARDTPNNEAGSLRHEQPACTR